jgi:hypothetical protein
MGDLPGRSRPDGPGSGRTPRRHDGTLAAGERLFVPTFYAAGGGVISGRPPPCLQAGQRRPIRTCCELPNGGDTCQIAPALAVRVATPLEEIATPRRPPFAMTSIEGEPPFPSEVPPPRDDHSEPTRQQRPSGSRFRPAVRGSRRRRASGTN